jgi:hypothetical protein
MMEAPGSKRLKPKHDEMPSNIAFKFNLRRYIMVAAAAATPPISVVVLDRPNPLGGDVVEGRGLHSSSSQLNSSALDGIGGTRRGCVAHVEGLLWGV